jgi:type II secretory pathway pseudopilin PulG
MSELSNSKHARRGEAGFSLLQVVITIAIIGVVTAMATISITRAQQDLRRDSTIREFKAYLEKARLDSIRRHATATADQATVTITASDTYQVSLDFNYDGTVSASERRTITIPSNRGVQFSTGTVSLPMTTRFDWRGRAATVQSDGTSVTSTFTMGNTYDYGSSPTILNLTSMGDASVGTAVTVTTPARTTVATSANVKSETNTNTSYTY